MLSLRQFIQRYLDNLYLLTFGKREGELPSLAEAVSLVARTIQAHTLTAPTATTVGVNRVYSQYSHIYYRALYYHLVSGLSGSIELDYSAPEDGSTRQVPTSLIVPSESYLQDFSVSWSEYSLPPGDV